MKILDVLRETPIENIEKVGDFSKRHSFYRKIDRALISSPKYINKVIEKFGKTKQKINIVFVNSMEARDAVELGKVSEKTVLNRLGKEVYDTVKNIHKPDTITIIYTNNLADKHVPITPWILAHRLMHAAARTLHPQFQNFVIGTGGVYSEMVSNLDDMVDYIYTIYAPNRPPLGDIRRDRRKQLFTVRLFSYIGTFKSARDDKIRGWFEVINEMGAQYIITGRVKLNDPPACITFNKIMFCVDEDSPDYSEIQGAVHSIAYGMNRLMNKLLDEMVGNIYIM